MKKSHFIAVICVLLLGGCACFKGLPTLEERSHPQVTLRDGRIVVSPEILFYFPDERNVLIVWQLPKDSKYRFTTQDSIFKVDGIVIEGRMTDRVVRGPAAPNSVGLEKQDEIAGCAVRNEGLEFTCLNKHTRSGVYKYTIRVVSPDSKEPLVRDPPIVNMRGGGG